MDTNQHPIQKKMGLPRIIAALAGIAIVGLGASWFGKNQKSEPAPSQVAEESRTEPLNPSQPPQLPSQDDISSNRIENSGPAISPTPTAVPNIKKEESSLEMTQAKKPVAKPQEPSQPTDQPATQQQEIITQKAEQPIIKQKESITQKKEFADGTYVANGAYISPAGEEEISISLTLKDEMIIDSKFTSGATNPSSKQWQNIFGSGYREKIIGKPINTLSLTAVSGSSLTPRGFMDALEKIKQQAKNAS